MAKKLWEYDIPPAFQKAEEALNKFNIPVPAIEASKELERTLSLCNSGSLKAVLGISEKLERTIPSWSSNAMEGVLGMSRSIEHLLPKHTIFEQNYGTAMLKAMEQAIPRYDLDGMTSALKGFSSVLEQMPKIHHQDLIDSIFPQIKTAFDVWDKSTALDALEKIDWASLSDGYAVDDYFECDSAEYADNFTDVIRDEMVTDINKVLEKPELVVCTWQEKYAKWKERNPALADLFSHILLPILVWLICFGIENKAASATKNANVYEEPSASSNIVYNITVEQNVTVIGDEKYYYEIEIPDPVTGETVIGYVYKGNLTITEAEKEPYGEEEMTPVSIGGHASKCEIAIAE